MNHQSEKGGILNREHGHFKFDELTHLVIGAAMDVHKELGPGLTESIYEQCLMFELDQRRVRFQHRVLLPIRYKQIKLPKRFRMDLVVEKRLMVEIRSIEEIRNLDESHMLACLKLANLSTGLLINFNVASLRDGIRRFMRPGGND